MRRSRISIAVAVAAVVLAATTVVAVAAGGRLLSQHSSGVAGAAEYGDFFASDVASGDFDGDGYDDAIVGVPFENVGTVKDGGAIQIVYGSATGLTSTGDAILHAASRGVAGAS